MVFGKCKSYKNWNCKSYDKCLCACNSENTKVRKSVWSLQNAKVKILSVVFENCKTHEKIRNAKVIKFVWFYKMQKLGTLCGF